MTTLYKVLRCVFRLLPLSQGTRDLWRNRFLDRYGGWAPPSPRGQSPGSGSRRLRARSDLPAIGHVEYRLGELPDKLPATLVAFYLPQFHVIEENDRWWGKGFTEWTNVVHALPQFEGHCQPRLPADLGFYDLRNVETMREQARLASEYGIGAFCFYFYWFGGTTLLETPLRNWLEDPHITLPFCVCWANENWARNWDGRSQDVLIAQRHSVEDDLAFIAHVASYLRDGRYLRIDGKPMLLVYRPNLLPDAAASALRWRKWCRENDIGEIHLAYVQGFERPDPRDIGFDSAVEFPPNLGQARDITADQHLINPDFEGSVLDWRELAAEMAGRPLPKYRLYPGVNTGWDNEPRRAGRGRILAHASPRAYGDWLQRTVHDRLENVPDEHSLVFINAWNEWAEGAVLEPDKRLGHAWLEATRRALAPITSSASPCSVAIVVHAWYVDCLAEIFEALKNLPAESRLIVTTSPEHVESVAETIARSGTRAEVSVYENRGRDILPFLHLANRLLDDGTDLILKLHTKKSIHRDDGDTWARELVTSLTRDWSRIINAFADDSTLGLVAPRGHLIDLEKYLGGNQENLAYLEARLGIPLIGAGARFPSGSMFWARAAALRPLLDAHLYAEDFEPESGQIDGSLAHAIERSMGRVVEQAGYAIKTTAEILGQEEPQESYRYAKASH